MKIEEVKEFIKKANKMNTKTQVLKWTYKEKDGNIDRVDYITILDLKANLYLRHNNVLDNEDFIINNNFTSYNSFNEERGETPMGYKHWIWEVISKKQMDREIVLKKIEESE